MYLHTPVKEGPFVTIAVGLSTCPCCKSPMIEAPLKALNSVASVVGSGLKDGGNSIAAQCLRGGLVVRSNSTNTENEKICENCANAGESSFICAMCKEKRASSEKEESFGDPPEFLCKVCYATKSAKDWDDIIKKLSDRHRWDFD